MLAIQSGITEGVVTVAQTLLGNLIDAAADALGHVLAGHFQMHSAGVAAHLVMDIEEGPELVTDGVEVARLVSRIGLAGVAVDGVGDPKHTLALPLDGPDESGQILAQLLGTHADNDGQPSGDVVGVHGIDDVDQFVGGALVGNLDADRIANATDEFEVGGIEVAGTLADPEHVGRAVVPLASGGVLPGKGLLVGEEEALVGGEEVGLGEVGIGRINANGLHETERLIDLGGKLAVTRTLLGVLHKVQVPSVETTEIGISTGRKGPKDVEGLGTLVVGLDHVEGVVPTSLLGELLGVDDVTAVRGEGNAILDLIGLGSGLGELSGHASNLDDGHGTSKGEDQTHLENDAEGIPNMIDVELIEGLGAVTAHEEEALSVAGTGQLLVEGADLAGKDEGAASLQFLDGIVEFGLIVVDGHLLGHKVGILPGFRSPFARCLGRWRCRSRDGQLSCRAAVKKEMRENGICM